MISIGSLRFDATHEGTTTRVVVTGDGDTRENAQLLELLMSWHRDALARGVREVRLDVRPVAFMNSTALSAFARWFSEVGKADKATRYRVVFEATKATLWQRSSLHSLAAFAPEHVEIRYS